MARISARSRCVRQLALVLLWISASHADEVWKQDLTSDMHIGPADSGYRKVQLRCGADYMQVDINTDEDFSGVIYTRGSFHDRIKPCFKDARSGKKFTLKFPLNKCQTKHGDDGVYSNVVVLQYDDQLIMPGDAAFTLECDFSQPRDITVSANLAADKTLVSSRISLADADPAGGQLPRHERSTVTSQSGTVSFTPDDIRPRKRRRKEEL